MRNYTMISKSASCLAVLVLACLVTGPAAREFPPAVQMKLRSATILIGEMPKIEIEITAPAENPVHVVKEDRFHLGDFSLIRLYGKDGPIVGGPPHELRNDEPDDFALLDSGKSISMTIPSLYSPQEAGQYTVMVALRPTSQTGVKYEARLSVTAVELRQEDILQTLPLQVIHTDRKMEILEVRTGKDEYALFHRRTREHQVTLARVVPVSKDATVTAETVVSDPANVGNEIRVRVAQDGKTVEYRLCYLTGTILSGPTPVGAAVTTRSTK